MNKSPVDLDIKSPCVQSSELAQQLKAQGYQVILKKTAWALRATCQMISLREYG